MLTRARLLASATMGLVTSFGYPDYAKPHDYLAGLASAQVATITGIASGNANLFTVPAGKTLIIRSLSMQLSVVGNGAGVYTLHGQVVYALSGFDGAGGATPIFSLACMATPAGYANAQLVTNEEIQIAGGAAGNIIQAQGVLTNAITWNGAANLYGSLVG